MALFAMLEAIVLTGLIAPGALVVVAGGILVHRGTIDYFDLVWFVAVGAALGSEISYRLGRLTAHRLKGRQRLAGSSHMQRAQNLLAAYGGFAMIISRFLGPLSAFVPFSAAMAGMSARRFTLWNVVSAVPYALILPAIGYFFGGAIGTLGAAAPRILAFGAGILITLALLWFLLGRLRRAWPLLASIVRSAARELSAKPGAQRLARRFPGATAFLANRFATAKFLGLTATVLVVLFLYLLGMYLDSVFDFVGDASVTELDARLANLLFAMRDTRLTAVFGWITALGGWQIVLPMLLGTGTALLLLRRHDLLAGLALTAVGSQLTVALLKSFFDRPRSPLGYFIETSGSFPSGHAAASVAVWGMIFYTAWRTRYLSATSAAMIAISLAFLIGLSRVYLIEHYLSDVLNGWLVGGLWLTLGVAFCEWRRDFTKVQAVTPNRRLGSCAVIAITLATALVLASLLSGPVNMVAEKDRSHLADLLASGDVTRDTNTLTGSPRARLSVVVAVRGAGHLISAMESQGWTRAPRPGIGTVIEAVWADWTGGRVPGPLVLPTFWNSRPNDLAFSKTGSLPGDLRRHVRLWRLGDANDGRAQYAGSVTVEDPLYVLEDDGGMPSEGTGSEGDLAAALQAAGLAARFLSDAGR